MPFHFLGCSSSQNTSLIKNYVKSFLSFLNKKALLQLYSTNMYLYKVFQWIIKRLNKKKIYFFFIMFSIEQKNHWYCVCVLGPGGLPGQGDGLHHPEARGALLTPATATLQAHHQTGLYIYLSIYFIMVLRNRCNTTGF